MESRSATSDLGELSLIQEFKHGYQEVIERQAALARTASQLLTAPIITPDERRIINELRNTVDKALAQLQTLCRSAISDLQPLQLDKEAMRDYHNVFSGDVTDHRLSYVRFLKTYALLKRLTLDLAEQWTIIQNATTRSELKTGSEFREQFLTYGVRAGLRACEAMQAFCRRMATLLQLQTDPVATKRFDGAGIYSADIDYALSAVFRENLDQWTADLFAEARRDPAQLGLATEARQERATAAAREAPASGGARGPEWRLDCAGTQPWNSTPHYYFQYDPRALEEERRGFSEIVYIDTHMGADQDFIKSDFIIKFSRKNNISDASTVEARYVDFLRTFFTLVTEISAMNIGVSPQDRPTFLYHLGPQSFYMLTLRFLQEVKTGTVHRKAPGGAMIRKYIPNELLKKTVLEYWRDEILPAVADARDDLMIFKRIAAQVRQTHAALSKHAISEFEKLPPSLKASKSRQDIFREKLPEWLGAPNIIIFRRFLKATAAQTQG